MSRFQACLTADQDHARQNAEAWTAPPGEFFAFYDQKGNRVWVRLERVLRVHFQHDPETPRRELASLIYRGMAWVVGEARKKNFEEVIFESRATRLIQFLEKLFGFKPVEGNFHLRT